jgi:hypothetical protein
MWKLKIGGHMRFVKSEDQMNNAERAFWATYAECLVKRDIVGCNGEWHVKHARSFCYSLASSLKRLRRRLACP